MNGIGLIDVGTDHAIIPISLARQGYHGKLFASDIHPGPIEKAKHAAKRKVRSRISLLNIVNKNKAYVSVEFSYR